MKLELTEELIDTLYEGYEKWANKDKGYLTCVGKDEFTNIVQWVFGVVEECERIGHKAPQLISSPIEEESNR